MNCYIGVDPGSTGAVAFIRRDNDGYGYSEQKVFDFESPETLEALRSISTHYQQYPGAVFAVVEKVNAMPKQGVSTTFKFGQAYGRVMGWLDACKIPYELVTPAKWWKAISDSAPKSADKKAMALELARRLFPDLAATHLKRKKDHNRAEALLISLYCARTRRASQPHPRLNPMP